MLADFVSGLTHKEDATLSKGEAEQHHQVTLLMDKPSDKANSQVICSAQFLYLSLTLDLGTVRLQYLV